jgi:predicted adenine nucleotide alpha hydrolase (AANH) superfamily ATPase
MDPTQVAEPSHEKKYSYKKESRVLVHMCCGPCSIYPIKELLRETAEVWGFFYNPNIHPHSEFRKRLDAVKLLANLISVNVICDESYKPVGFIKNLKASIDPGKGETRIPPIGERCTYCYSSRLEETAKAALEHGFTAFSSSLLYSKYQNHEEIRSLGVEIGELYGIPFHYEDFRAGWRDGVDSSKEMGLYRQKYCGCIYSRIERFSDKGKKAAKV